MKLGSSDISILLVDSMPRTTSLSLVLPGPASPVSSTITSPTASETTSTSPRSVRHGDKRLDRPEDPLPTTKAKSNTIPLMQDPSQTMHIPSSPNITSLPPFPASPKAIPKHVRDQSRSFFSNLKASKSSNRVHHVEPTIRQVQEEAPPGGTVPGENPIYSFHNSSGSTPDLSTSTFETDSQDANDTHSTPTGAVPRRPTGNHILSDSTLVTSQTEPVGTSKKGKPRFGHLLNRTRSTRVDDGMRKSKPGTPIRITPPEDLRHFDGAAESNGLRTAPLQHEKDRSFRDMMGSAMRNRSADRQPTSSNQGSASVSRIENSHVAGLTVSASTVSRESGGARTHLMNNLKTTSTKAADGLGKAGKGILGKIARSGSSNAREGPEDEPYVCSTINLPLVEQTRRTRIAKRLENSKDKTEFWMPSLPWRCIDFLNFRGCEEEGLYRIPGSGPKVREWQRRFDREGDIDLFDEPDLYDINIIGSMFKAWLRDLPTEILPKATQAKIARECAGAREVPQLLKDELSRLPPWNYYLLFAITCHLSLLHAYVDKNKMNYSNLCICFQPCLKIDAFCFQFLVCDWKKCWQGCWTEKEALEEEYKILDGIQPRSSESSGGSIAVGEEPSPSSFQSGKEGSAGRGQDRGRPPPISITAIDSATPPTPTQTPIHHLRSPSQLPELAPMAPLSPMGL